MTTKRPPTMTPAQRQIVDELKIDVAAMDDAEHGRRWAEKHAKFQLGIIIGNESVAAEIKTKFEAYRTPRERAAKLIMAAWMAGVPVMRVWRALGKFKKRFADELSGYPY